jgi:hypothetical protein
MEKQYCGIDLVCAGMQIDFSDVHLRKASRPISVSLEPDSNVTCDRYRQSLEQLSPRISTAAGMQIDVNSRHSEKAPLSIRVIFEQSSNETADID